MNLVENLKQTFKQGNAVTQIIFINISVFLGLKLISLLLILFNIEGSFIYQYLLLPSHLPKLLFKPWTVVSYMFLHKDFMHILFNMLALFWFGRIFLNFFTEKQFFGVYLFGGLLAAVFFIVAYNIFPYFQDKVAYATLLGASGSVIAIITASATQAPNMSLRVFLIGSIKLKYIAIITVLISLFGITSSNAGGEFAHLGGALYGYLFVVSLRKGKDHTKGFNRFMDKVFNLFKKKNKNNHQSPKRKMTDAEYNMSKANKMKEIDRILDKIKKSGYGSLTDEEKKNLFKHDL